MYKVIIVDDEPMIRKGLRAIIPWNELGFEVVDIAKNGRDGYEKYQQHSPNLMIVDIKMPEMNGITLLEKIREENESIHFIILSGYAEFDYAKKAIGCKCDGFLLKPLDEEELITHLKGIFQKLQNEKQLYHLLNEDKGKMREEFMRKLVHSKHSDIGEDVKRLADYYQVSSDTYQTAILTINDEEISAKVKSIVEASKRGFVIEKSEYLILLFLEDFLSKHRTNISFHQLILLIKEQQLYAAIGDAVNRIEDIPHSYQSALAIFERKFFYPKGKLLSSKELKATFQVNDEQGTKISIDSYVERLYYSMDIVNMTACEKITNELFEELSHHDNSELDVKKIIFHIYTNTINKLLLANPDLKSLHSFITSAGDLFEMQSIPCIKQYFLKQIQQILSMLDNGETDVTLKKLIDLIHKEYNQSLRLETLADVFNYNSAYLGKLFKNYTGEYFNTYLDKVRIENGKKLLEKGYKVYEVAEKVGYANVDYFHRKFKKYVGVSPSSFRKEG
ncbi:response regulator transcription factor [Virgibacillus sp. 6R]|uniref:response regulator n=1 Tax=Metabacillus sp. 22489 TaxID=3453928 RepID=UPI0016423DB4